MTTLHARAGGVAESDGADKGRKRLEVGERGLVVSSVVPLDEGGKPTTAPIIQFVFHAIHPVRTECSDPVHFIARAICEHEIDLAIKLPKKTIDAIRPMLRVFDFEDEHGARGIIRPFDPCNFHNEVSNVEGDTIFNVILALWRNNVTLDRWEESCKDGVPGAIPLVHDTWTMGSIVCQELTSNFIKWHARSGNTLTGYDMRGKIQFLLINNHQLTPAATQHSPTVITKSYPINGCLVRQTHCQA